METEFDITDQTAELDDLGTAELEAGEEEPAGLVEQELTDRPPVVFISYNRKHDERIARHIHDALRQECEVYLDQESNALGVQYVPHMEAWLNRSDFFIVLISKGSLDSGWVVAELEAAHRLRRERGRPALLPVCVEYTGAYPLDVSAYIGRTHALFWDSRNAAAHVARIRAVVLNAEPPAPAPVNVGMDGMLVRDNRRARLAETFVAPHGLVDEGFLRDHKLLWLTGDADVRNYAALSLAARDQAASLYEVPPSRTWSEVNNTGVSDSAIILRDAAPATHFNEATAGEELNGLRALIERGNVIVATGPDEEFERVRQAMLRYEFGDCESRGLGRNSYDEAAKLRLLDNLLNFSLRSFDLSEEQVGWVRELEAGGRLNDVVKKWAPSDIETFVTYSLPQVQRGSDVARLLRRNAALEDEVHEWFLSLDDSARCFVLAVALFPETEADFLWERYKEIGRELRRLDPRLSLNTFGVCRQFTGRYVSREGPIYFRDEHVAEAIRTELVRSYREYFVELDAKLREWTVPEGREVWPQEASRKQKAREGRHERASVARMAGSVGRFGLSDKKLSGLMKFWATDPNFYVRHAVADALVETVRSHGGVSHALSLLEPWCREPATGREARFRACAAAVALGALAAAQLDDAAAQRVVECVRRLARSQSRDVRFHVSIALRDLVRGLPFSALEAVLTRVAAEKRPDARVGVRVNVADALNAARERDPSADERWRAWPFAENEGRRWTSLCALLIDRDANARGGTKSVRPDKYELLFELLADKEVAGELLQVCAETLPHERQGEAAADTFKRLVGEVTGEAREGLASALSRVTPAQAKRLMPLLHSHGLPALEERLLELWVEDIKGKAATPELFVGSLRAWLARDELRREMFGVLARVFDSGPAGCRPQAVWALAEVYAEDPGGLEALLAQLSALAPTYFESLAESVTQQAHAGNRRPDGLRRILLRRPGVRAPLEGPRLTFVKRLVTRFIKKKV